MRAVFFGWLAMLLAMAMAGPAAAAEPWPTLSFELVEGSQDPVADAAAALARAAGQGPEPLSPQLKLEIETYLSTVASEYQRMGFPPPQLEPIVARSDGSRAYRVYWYAFGGPGRGTLDPARVALMAYGCRGEDASRAMNLNARTEGANGLHNRLAIATGRVPGRLDQLTDKGYADLAHELFHAVQRGTAFYDANCEPPAWFTEGMAEAVGHDMAWKLKRIRSGHDPFNRWGLRPYFQPFDAAPGTPDKEKTARGYGTSSFWRYLAELERAMQSSDSPPPKPGPQRVNRADAFDYGYLVRLLSQAPRLADGGRTMDWIDGWLRTDQRLDTRFDRVFADFVGVIADFGSHRIDGVLPVPKRRDNAQLLLFDGCKEVTQNPAQGAEELVVLALPAVSARCLRLHRQDTQDGVLAVDIRTEVTAAQARSLWLGRAGETSAVAATLHDHPRHTIANWVLLLEPGQSVDVVVANVANTPSGSEDFKPTFRISVPGWQWTGTGPVPAPQPRLRPGADRTRSGRGELPPPGGPESEPVTQGPATAQLHREQDVDHAPGCRWPYADARLHCGPAMTLVLKRLPRWLAHLDSGFSDAPARHAGSLESFAASRSADALRALDDLEVRIRLPRLEHGFKGVLENVLVTVAADGNESVTRGPRDAESGTLAYFPASGRLVVDQYDSLVFRGRFEGDVVALPLPNAHREDRPLLPVLGRVEGRFLVGQPWAGDDRYTPVAPEADQGALRIRERMPGPLRGALPATMGTGPVAAPGDAGPGQGEACDCSCAGHQRLMREIEDIDRTRPDLGADPAMLATTMCLLTCQAAWSACAAE
ncbi:hypothetical protein [Arenimonas sp.]|uniref:hypothetical protein n=1 Tax=Arenimonas sp. TaxID=1872635 RepID=UPI0035B49B4B